jgi:hypothetical protein
VFSSLIITVINCRFGFFVHSRRRLTKRIKTVEAKTEEDGKYAEQLRKWFSECSVDDRVSALKFESRAVI